MKIDIKEFKSAILKAGVNEKVFDEAVTLAKSSGREIGDVLIANGTISEEKIAKIEADILGFSFVVLEKERISPDILKIIPESLARTKNVIAFKKDGDNLQVAMLDPNDLRTIEFIKKTYPSLNILPSMATSNGIKVALSRYQKTLETEFKDIVSEEAGNLGDDGEKKSGEDLKKITEELPIIRIVDSLLKHAILEGASDVHIEPLDKSIVVRYRIDGLLRDAMKLPVSAGAGIVARIKVLSNLKLDEHRLPQDGRLKIETDEFKYSVRVSILPVFNGEKIVMRLLAEGTKSYNLNDLGFQGKAFDLVKDSLQKPSGMILITGPTGSGKTTTLYGMMGILNTPDVNISTVEDPIEYRMPRINQTQVNAKIGLTFAAGLRVLLRQDPDIIMVGEIRDDETAELAINAALTGHLVLSTLHTTEAAGAMPRLTDMKAEPFLLSSTINVIIAQRLVRKIYSQKEAYKMTADELKDLAKYCNLEKILQILKNDGLARAKDTMKDVNFYRAKPSEDCPDGYKGRLGIFEVLAVTDTIKDLIVKKATTKEVAAQAIKEGMRTMIEDGFVKAAQGVTSIEEVLRVITE